MTYYNCPNCGKEMENMLESEWVDFDESEYYIVGSECKKCKIKYHDGDGTHAEGWELPKELQPTEKQIKTVLFIKNRMLGKNEFPVTKKQYCAFISKYFEQAKKTEYPDRFDDTDDYSDYYFEEEF